MAGRKRKYRIALTNDIRNRLKEIIRSKKISKTIKKRCEILLALDSSQNTKTTYEDCAYYLGVSVSMISKLVKLYSQNGLDSILVLNRNTNSDNANRKIDGVLEARIIAMACISPPEGYARWTIKLLTEHAKVKLELSAGEEAVRRMLKKRSASTSEGLLVHSAKAGC